MRARVTAEKEDEILALYASGLGVGRIGKRLGLHHATVNNVRRRRGEPPRYRPGRRPKGVDR